MYGLVGPGGRYGLASRWSTTACFFRASTAGLMPAAGVWGIVYSSWSGPGGVAGSIGCWRIMLYGAALVSGVYAMLSLALVLSIAGPSTANPFRVAAAANCPLFGSTHSAKFEAVGGATAKAPVMEQVNLAGFVVTAPVTFTFGLTAPPPSSRSVLTALSSSNTWSW